MIDKETKTNFESFSKDYPDLGPIVKDARTKIVNLTKQLDDLNSAPQPAFRPGADSGVNSGNSKNENIKKQIFDAKAELGKQTDERTTYYPPEIKQDIDKKINYLTNPENKELDEKESKESFDFMEKMHFREKEKQGNADKQYRMNDVERSSARFNAMLVSYREEEHATIKPEMDKSDKKDNENNYPKSSDFYTQSLNYKVEPLKPQEPESPNNNKKQPEKEEVSKDEIEDRDLEKENDIDDKQYDDLPEKDKVEPEKENLDKEETEEEKEINDKPENKEADPEKEWVKVDHDVKVTENTEYHTVTYELQEKDGAFTDVPEPNVEDIDPEPEKD